MRPPRPRCTHDQFAECRHAHASCTHCHCAPPLPREGLTAFLARSGYYRSGYQETATSTTRRLCTRCHTQPTRRGNSKYCPACADAVHRERIQRSEAGRYHACAHPGCGNRAHIWARFCPQHKYGRASYHCAYPGCTERARKRSIYCAEHWRGKHVSAGGCGHAAAVAAGNEATV